MVGSRFCELATNFEIIKADPSGEIPIDITNKNSVQNLFQNHSFNVAILFSAYTDVDGAENQRNDKNGPCWQINVLGTQNVISACQDYKRKLIFISTDFVFDGNFGPYSEDDPPGPDLNEVSWYGISKIEAEKNVKTLNEFIILRIAFPYRANFAGKDDIVKKILRRYQEVKLYPMFVDNFFTPTFIDDLAPAIELLVTKNQKGVFHLASPTTTNWYDFAKEVLSIFASDPNQIKKGSIIEYLKKNPVPRPLNSALKVEKIKNLGFTPTDWKKGIRIIHQQSGGKLI